MYPVSARFLETITGSHQAVVRVRALDQVQFGASPVGGTELPVLSGDVALASTSDVKGSIDLTVPGDYLELLEPYGVEIFAERGVDFGDGTTEYVPLGYFRVEDIDQDDAPSGPVKVAGADRVAQLQDSRLLYPYPYPAGTTHAELFDRLVNGYSISGVPVSYGMYLAADVPIEFVGYDGDETLPAGQVDDDPYEHLAKIADARGCVLRFARTGELRIEARDRAPGTPAVYAIRPGQGGNLIKASRRITRRGVYNIVVARGSDPNFVTGYRLAYNDDQGSPLYWQGRFGAIPRYYASPLLHTSDAADAAAETILARYKGLPSSTSVLVVPNPALDPLDPIQVSLGGQVAGHLVDEMSIPLVGSSAVNVATRVLNELPPLDETGGQDGEVSNPDAPGGGASSGGGAGTGSGITLGTPVFSETFTAGNFAAFAAIQNNPSGGQDDTPASYDQGPYHLKVANVGADRTSVVRFEIRDGDRAGTSSSAERNELVFPSSCDVVEGDERWYQFDLRLGEPVAADKVSAARDISARLKSGSAIFEDWTWSGAPGYVGIYNDELLAEYPGSSLDRPAATAWLDAYVAVSGVWVAPTSWFLIWQWHQQASSGSPPLALEVIGNRVTLTSDGFSPAPARLPLWTVRPGVWERVILHVGFSRSAAAGFVEAFVNGTQVLPRTARATMLDSENYLKMGIYRDGAHTATNVVSFDNIVVARAAATGGGSGGGGTADNPGALLQVGTRWHGNCGIGFSPGDDPQGSSGAVHRDQSQSLIRGGLQIPGYFEMTPDRARVRLSAHLDGGRTSANTKFPRTEFRELEPDGTTKSLWSPNRGVHRMWLSQRVTRLAAADPRICLCQTHDPSDDTAMIRVEGSMIIFRRQNDQVVGTLGGFSMNTDYDMGIEIVDGTIRYFWGPMGTGFGSPVFTAPGAFNTSTGQYFKWGNYQQSRTASPQNTPVEDGPVITEMSRCLIWHTGRPEPATF